jgi:hypothetical protein
MRKLDKQVHERGRNGWNIYRGCHQKKLPSNLYIEEFCLLRNNAVQTVESQPIFRRNMSPPFSGSKNTPSKKPA